MALLGKKEEGRLTQPPMKREEEPVSTRPGDIHTLLGRGSEFDGKLTFEGQVRIDGKFNGQIFTKDVLVVGDGARITAEISAGTVIVNGTVEGNIRATTGVELHPPARVKGTIEAPSIHMVKGVIFEGSTKMENLGKGGTAATPAPAAAEARK